MYKIELRFPVGTTDDVAKMVADDAAEMVASHWAVTTRVSTPEQAHATTHGDIETYNA